MVKRARHELTPDSRVGLKEMLPFFRRIVHLLRAQIANPSGQYVAKKNRTQPISDSKEWEGV
jgi:hypothetical protein